MNGNKKMICVIRQKLPTITNLKASDKSFTEQEMVQSAEETQRAMAIGYDSSSIVTFIELE